MENLLDTATALGTIFGTITAVLSLPRSKMLGILALATIAAAAALIIVYRVGIVAAVRQTPWQELSLVFAASLMLGTGHHHIQRVLALILMVGMLLALVASLAVLYRDGTGGFLIRLEVVQQWLATLHPLIIRVAELRFISVASVAGLAAGIGVEHLYARWKMKR